MNMQESLGSILRRALEAPIKVPAHSAANNWHLNYRCRRYRYMQGQSCCFPRPETQFDLPQMRQRKMVLGWELKRGKWPWFEEDAGYAI